MIIDIYNHFMPKPFMDRLADLVPGHIVLKAFPRLQTLWDLDARLKLLDRFPDYQQVLSLANPPLELLGTPARRRSWHASPMMGSPSFAAASRRAFPPSSPRCP